MTTLKVSLLFGLLALSSYAFAEGNCPDGMVPIGGGDVVGCMPIQNNQNSPPAQPRGRWVDRWGAIAIGSTANGGGVGVSTGMLTKRQAEKAAVSQCKANGGGAECKDYVLRYRNQCAVIAWGDNSYMMQGAETIQVASKIALDKCSLKTTNCKIWYSDCSLSVWVQ
jgi:Domain of unknown function (DUF4189)